MTMDKQQERLGSGKKRTPRDNLDLDVMDALAQGYGCHYGHFKADHPFTKDANEARLAGKKTKSSPRPYTPRARFYVMTCRGCGQEFTTTVKNRRYCGDHCKKKKENAADRARHKKGGN